MKLAVAVARHRAVEVPRCNGRCEDDLTLHLVTGEGEVDFSYRQAYDPDACQQSECDDVAEAMANCW